MKIQLWFHITSKIKKKYLFIYLYIFFPSKSKFLYIVKQYINPIFAPFILNLYEQSLPISMSVPSTWIYLSLSTLFGIN